MGGSVVGGGEVGSDVGGVIGSDVGGVVGVETGGVVAGTVVGGTEGSVAGVVLGTVVDSVFGAEEVPDGMLAVVSESLLGCVEVESVEGGKGGSAARCI